jgi:hypothetical protein
MIEKVGQLNEEKECDYGAVVGPANLEAILGDDYFCYTQHLYDINKTSVLCIEESLVYPSLVENYRVETLQSLLYELRRRESLSLKK